MPQFQTPYGTVDAPEQGAVQKWLAKQRGAPQDTGTSSGGTETPSAFSALWEGLKRGGRDVLEGGAQIGARMGEVPQVGASAPEMPGGAARVDQSVRQSAADYAANPARQAHPVAAGVGRFGGNVAASLPFSPPGAPGVAGRAIQGVVAGAQGGAMSPVTDAGNFLWEKTKQIATGSVAGGELGAVGGALEKALSPLAHAIAGNSERDADVALARDYRAAIKPRALGRPSVPALTVQDQRIVSAVDRIIQDRDKLKLTHEGSELPPGSVPKTLRQFFEATDQVKRGVFAQYDQMAQGAAGAGLRVDLFSTVEKLRHIAESPEVRDIHPSIAADAQRLADVWEKRGSLTPSEAQDMLQHLSQTLQSFYRNPTAESVSQNSVYAAAAATLREQLDKTITAAQGPGYQNLKNQYGALKSVEQDVTRAVQREANKRPGLGQTLGELGAAEEAMRGLIFLDPKAIGRSMAIKGAQAWLKHINSPNRAVSRMFEHRLRTQEGQKSALSQAMENARRRALFGGAPAGAGMAANRNQPEPHVSVIGP